MITLLCRQNFNSFLIKDKQELKTSYDFPGGNPPGPGEEGDAHVVRVCRMFAAMTTLIEEAEVAAIATSECNANMERWQRKVECFFASKPFTRTLSKELDSERRRQKRVLRGLNRPQTRAMKKEQQRRDERAAATRAVTPEDRLAVFLAFEEQHPPARPELCLHY